MNNTNEVTYISYNPRAKENNGVECGNGKRRIFFEVPDRELFALISFSKNIQESSRMALESGLRMEASGLFNCASCVHYNGEEKIQGSPSVYVEGCIYKNEELKYASRCSLINGERAWMTPCAGFDSRIKQLIESGQLNEFKLSEYREREFLKIADIALELRKVSMVRPVRM